ncbi:hypothetical protein [Streptomyces sp. NBC_00009]|uniref:hypothetical protein n=1 Tax=Streptomyces sp. NBC_00009 TaxID=2975620 RepID=UPI00324DE455
MNGAQRAGRGADPIAFMDAPRLPQAPFAGYDWGGRAGDVTTALRPERCTGVVSVNGNPVQNLTVTQEPLTPRSR